MQLYVLRLGNGRKGLFFILFIKGEDAHLQAGNIIIRVSLAALIHDIGGDHTVIHSVDQGEKVSRIRFTRIGIDRDGDRYELGVATHTGRWQHTPFTGDIHELFAVVTEQFPWVLEDY